MTDDVLAETTAEDSIAAATRPAPRGSTGWQKFMRIAFHVVAITEAITWTGLLYGMYMRYVVGVSEDADPVPFWGMAHGMAFVVFCAVVMTAGWTFRWRIREYLIALAAAVPPLTTIPLEIWYSRTRKLKAPLPH